MSQQHYSYFSKQFRQAVADNRITSLAEAEKYASDWWGNGLAEVEAERDALKQKVEGFNRLKAAYVQHLTKGHNIDEPWLPNPGGGKNTRREVAEMIDTETEFGIKQMLMGLNLAMDLMAREKVNDWMQLVKERDRLQNQINDFAEKAIAGQVEYARLKQENAELVEALRESDLLMNEVAGRLHVRGDFHNAAELQKARVAVDDIARHATPEVDYIETGRKILAGEIILPQPDPFAGLPGYEPKQPIFDNEEEGSDALRLRRANETKDEMISRRLDNLLKP